MTSADERKQYDQSLIAEFRANGGKVSGWETRPRPLLLLTTKGPRSGKPHTTPLSYITDGDRLIVFANNSGALSHPHWHGNLVAHPDVTVELGDERWQTQAIVAKGPERERLFNLRAVNDPWLLECQSKAKRQIPVVILARVPASTSL